MLNLVFPWLMQSHSWPGEVLPILRVMQILARQIIYSMPSNGELITSSRLTFLLTCYMDRFFALLFLMHVTESMFLDVHILKGYASLKSMHECIVQKQFLFKLNEIRIHCQNKRLEMAILITISGAVQKI